MKIIIRKAKKGDAAMFANLRNEALRRGFLVYNGSNRILSKKEFAKIDNGLSNKANCSFFAFDSDTDKLVGECSFSGKVFGRSRHRVDFGWSVHPDYARQGIATRLLNVTISEARKRGIKRIEAEVAVKNIPSIKLAKRFGFKIEGKRKSGLILDNGKYVDTYLFGKIL